MDIVKCGVKYLFGDCWVIFCLFQHQQQVVTAVERAKQVTMTELNAIVGVSSDVTALALSVSKFNLLSIINEFQLLMKHQNVDWTFQIENDI